MPCSVCKTVPDTFLVIIASVTTSVTKAPVVAPSIGAAAPELNTLPTMAPPPAPRLVTPAFFSVVHDIKRTKTVNKNVTCRPIRQLLGMPTSLSTSRPTLLQPARLLRTRTSFSWVSLSICPCCLLYMTVYSGTVKLLPHPQADEPVGGVK